MTNLLFASLLKEFRLLSRDLHALLVLFVMPLSFVLVMSLALQDQIGGQSSIRIAGELQILEPSEATQRFAQLLQEREYLVIVDGEQPALFHVSTASNFESALRDEYKGEALVSVSYSPELGLRERMLIFAAVKEAFALVNVFQLAEELGFDEHYAREELIKDAAVVNDLTSEENRVPVNATQQNVPAWLVFAMFFVSLPISTMVISERRQKSLLRLRTMGVSTPVWLASKLLPFFLINMVQLLFLVLVGVGLLPLFGGIPLSLEFSWLAFGLMGASVSMAALGYAAFVACICKTTEQATVVAGTSNILFAAIGGIMVPAFIMPEFMRWITLLSPMGWGLDGFVAIVARGSGVRQIAGSALGLSGFALLMMVLALWLFSRQVERDG